MEKQFLGPLPCSVGSSIAVDHSVWLVHKPHICIVVFYNTRFDSLARFLGEKSFNRGACIFIRMYTSHLSIQRTTLRVPLTCVAMFPLFIFRDFGPISCGIPCLSWRTVPHALIFHWNRSGEIIVHKNFVAQSINSLSNLQHRSVCCCCLSCGMLPLLAWIHAHIISVAQRVVKFVNFDTKSSMFLWNVLLKGYSSFVQHDQLFHSKIFCRIIQLTKFVVQIK